MAWFLELKWRGKNAYPLLREKFKDPTFIPVRIPMTGCCGYRTGEIFKAFGYYVTESSLHMSRLMFPISRKQPELIKKIQINGAKLQASKRPRLQQDDRIKEAT